MVARASSVRTEEQNWKLEWQKILSEAIYKNLPDVPILVKDITTRGMNDVVRFEGTTFRARVLLMADIERWKEPTTTPEYLRLLIKDGEIRAVRVEEVEDDVPTSPGLREDVHIDEAGTITHTCRADESGIITLTSPNMRQKQLETALETIEERSNRWRGIIAIILRMTPFTLCFFLTLTNT